MRKIFLAILFVSVLLLSLTVCANCIEPVCYVEPSAITFVSADYPDTAFGNSNNMVISGGDDANVLFISFKTSELTDLGYAVLELDVKNEGSTKTDVYLIDDYLADGASLTYNTMPSLAESAILVTQDMSYGKNRLELQSVLDKVGGEYFTLVFKSRDTDVHSYYVDFESFETLTANNGSVVIEDVEYFYGYSDEYFHRYGGDFGKSTLSVIKDPVDQLNNVARVKSGGTGRIKLYNALSHDVLEEADFQKTYRFSFRVKDGNAEVGNLRYGIMPASGTAWSYADAVLEKNINDEGWTDLSYDLTLSETAVEVGEVNDPMFTINMVGDNYLDEIYVAELDENGNEKIILIDAQGGISVSVYDSAVPVAAAYVSSKAPNSVCGGDELLIGNSSFDNKIAFLSYVNTAVKQKNSLLLKFPDGMSEMNDVEVFLLPDYLVDADTLTYSTVPNFGEYLGRYDISGGQGIDLSGIEEKITGSYFTLVLRKDHHYYFENFENRETVEKATSPTLGYSSESFYSIGGSGVTLSVADLNGNSVLYATTKTTATGRFKFFNTLTSDEITEADVGKTYRFSLDILAKSSVEEEEPTDANKVVVGVIPASGTSIYSSGKEEYKKISETDWERLEAEYTITEDDVGAQLMFTVQFTKSSSAPQIYYYLDNLKVVEIKNGAAVEPSDDISAQGSAIHLVDGLLDTMMRAELDEKVCTLKITVSNPASGEADDVTQIFGVAGKGYSYSLLNMDNDTGELFFVENGTMKYLCDFNGKRYSANSNSLCIQAIYDDSDGSVRFAVGDRLACVDAGAFTDSHIVIPGGISGAAYVGVCDALGLEYSEITVSHMTADAPEIVGFQISELSKSLRILAGIDSLCYNGYGFKIEYIENGETVKTEDIKSPKSFVYSSVIADDKTVTAESLGTTYLACMNITDIKSDGMIKITPYTTVGEYVHEGKSATYDVKADAKLGVTEHISLDGKKIIFIGQSFVYYGNTVLETGTSVLTQAERTGDEGYFYQLCKTNGENVTVTNFTFGGHSITNFASRNCSANRGCNGVDHLSYIKDMDYDYVILGLGSGDDVAEFKATIETMMEFFRDGNPKVQIAILVPARHYGVINNGTVLTEALSKLKWAEEQGCIIVDWGGVVKGILDGSIEIPNSGFTYNQNSFVVSKSESDGYHPNQLAGYITTLMTYSALTNKPALGQSYAFCGDDSLCDHSAYRTFDEFKKKYYTYGDKTTNYAEVFASESEMAGIQSAIDDFLKEKAYRNYTE